jgi:hypothetical protein
VGLLHYQQLLQQQSRLYCVRRWLLLLLLLEAPACRSPYHCACHSSEGPCRLCPCREHRHVHLRLLQERLPLLLLLLLDAAVL